MTEFAAIAAVGLFAGGMIFAAMKDVASFTIPNWLVLSLAVAFAVLAPMAGLSGGVIIYSVLFATAMLFVGFTLFACGWIGGGDAKLATVAVLWIGPSLALDFLLYTSIAGGLLTFAILQYRRLPLPAFMGRTNWSARLHDTQAGVPYGVALATGALLVLPRTAWLAAF